MSILLNPQQLLEGSCCSGAKRGEARAGWEGVELLTALSVVLKSTAAAAATRTDSTKQKNAPPSANKPSFGMIKSSNKSALIDNGTLAKFTCV